MPDRIFLDKYTGQSLGDLLALEASHRVDSLVLAIEAGLRVRAKSHGVAALSPAERAVLDVEALEREVNNGGYHQFFFNAPSSAVSVVASLSAIGAAQHRALAERALAALPIREPTTAESISVALNEGGDALVDALNEIDEQFYASDEDVAGLLFAYIKVNAGSISIP